MIGIDEWASQRRVKSFDLREILAFNFFDISHD